MTVWTEHRNPEGRTYWFNTTTRESVWEKPDDLKTPFERALNETKWKEYFSGGRKYYYNTESKESKWDMPDELLLLLEKVEKEGKPSPAAATNGPARITAPEDPASSADQPNGTAETAVGPHTGGLPFASGSILPVRPNLPDDPVIPHNGFATVEEGQKAFTHLLRKGGVDAGWTWDQTMRAIITDPLYKALNTLAERKACWQKYTEGLKAKEHEEREARLAKLRPALRNMLKGNPNVFHYTTFATADRLFAQHPIWQQARVEAERRLVFEEYVAELKQREVQEARAARSRGIAKVVTLFKQLGVDVVTRWRHAHARLAASAEWARDAELQALPTLDVLLAFEDYSRVREREYEETERRRQVDKARRERKAREGFRALLAELAAAGHIRARTQWKAVYPLFRDDARYAALLGSPGSNPLELFWDAVDRLDQALDARMGVVEGVVGAYLARGGGGEQQQADDAKEGKQEGEGKDGEVKEEAKPFVTPDTTEEEFRRVVAEAQAWAEAKAAAAAQAQPNQNTGDTDGVENEGESVKALKELKEMGEDDLRLIWETLREQALKRQADEKRRAERRQRHLQDDLRYALKKLPGGVDVGMSYEEVVPLIENLPEYKAIDDEESRRAAFAKFVKRQKERLREASDDGASTTSRKRKEPHRERDRGDRADRTEREGERDGGRDRERDREWDKGGDRDRDGGRDRERERDREVGRDGGRDGGKERERGGRHHRYDEFEGHRASRDYGREREYPRERERDGEREKDGDRKEREGYRSKHGAHYRDRDEKDERDGREARDGREGRDGRDGRKRKSSRTREREWDASPVSLGKGRDGREREGRERSVSYHRDEHKEKRDGDDHIGDERAEKRVRYDDKPDEANANVNAMEVDEKPAAVVERAESPEEGEI
ncbi:hypothetical protein CCMSSC00406_0004855 [Pleurotus cornucopiae]|uniref:Uncharacterized protein n=1 Tax=Pleurotus cornucopiae TaxID=5321 RepID=A0ACB7J1B1_PLECO|nr:hypothetical protein CCMSSC00406_0004855 [Pleurotus cornucopiae]